LFLYYIF